MSLGVIRWGLSCFVGRGWSCFVGRCWSKVGRGFGFTWCSFVGNFYDVTRIAISSVVFDNLSTAIGKGNPVFTRSRVAITRFTCCNMYSGNIIICAVSVLVLSFDIGINWLLVGWGVVSGSSMVYWGVVSFSCMVDWCMVSSSSMIGWGNFVNWGSVVGWGNFVNWGSVEAWGMSYSMAESTRVSMTNCSMAMSSVGSSKECNKNYEGLKMRKNIRVF